MSLCWGLAALDCQARKPTAIRCLMMNLIQTGADLRIGKYKTNLYFSPNDWASLSLSETLRVRPIAVMSEPNCLPVNRYER